MGKGFNTFLAISSAGLSIPITKAMSDSNKDNGAASSSPISLPQPPSSDAVQEQAQDITKRRRASASESIYTSPLGVSGQANIAKKMLLGS